MHFLNNERSKLIAIFFRSYLPDCFIKIGKLAKFARAVGDKPGRDFNIQNITQHRWCDSLADARVS
jgi:hypothetical protein